MKHIEETFTSISHKRTFYVQTDDGDRYVFYNTPWSEKPIYSHRYHSYKDGEGERDFNNRLPQKVEEVVMEKYGGYFKQRLEEV